MDCFLENESNKYLFSFIPSISETREIFGIKRNDNMCKYDEAFTQAEMLEETGFCKSCKFGCPNRGKSEVIT